MSQIREKIEDLNVMVAVPKNSDGEIVLYDEEEEKFELWVERDDCAGYVIEIDGVGFEFVRTIREMKQ